MTKRGFCTLPAEPGRPAGGTGSCNQVSRTASRQAAAAPDVAERVRKQATLSPSIGSLARCGEAPSRQLKRWALGTGDVDMNAWLDAQAEVIREAARRHRIRSVCVFGSMARNDAGADSDVDLLVELDPGAGLLDQLEFKEELERRWSRRVDVVTPAALHWYIRDKVMREAQPL